MPFLITDDASSRSYEVSNKEAHNDMQARGRSLKLYSLSFVSLFARRSGTVGMSSPRINHAVNVGDSKPSYTWAAETQPTS